MARTRWITCLPAAIFLSFLVSAPTRGQDAPITTGDHRTKVYVYNMPTFDYYFLREIKFARCRNWYELYRRIRSSYCMWWQDKTWGGYRWITPVYVNEAGIRYWETPRGNPPGDVVVEAYLER